MGWDRLDELLEKYWEGDTSRGEEHELMTLLQSGGLPERYNKERDLFQFYSIERSGTLDNNRSESYIKELNRKEGTGGRVIRLVWNGLKIAAVIVVIATAGWIIRSEMKEQPDSMQSIADTFEDPQEALEETKKALMLLSKNLGKGKSQAVRFKAFSEAQEKARNLEADDKEENL